MEISLPGLPVEAVGLLCLAQDTNVNVDKVRMNHYTYMDNQRHFNKYI